MDRRPRWPLDDGPSPYIIRDARLSNFRFSHSALQGRRCSPDEFFHGDTSPASERRLLRRSPQFRHCGHARARAGPRPCVCALSSWADAIAATLNLWRSAATAGPTITTAPRPLDDSTGMTSCSLAGQGRVMTVDKPPLACGCSRCRCGSSDTLAERARAAALMGWRAWRSCMTRAPALRRVAGSWRPGPGQHSDHGWDLAAQQPDACWSSAAWRRCGSRHGRWRIGARAGCARGCAWAGL